MRKKLLIMLPIFLIAELCLYILILFFSTEFTLSLYCYSAVVLAFAFALCFFKVRLEYFLLLGGLLATVCADTFLILPKERSYTDQVVGMCFFMVTQILYFAYLLRTEHRRNVRIAHCIVRGVAILAAEIILVNVLKENTDFLSVLSLAYIANLCVSVLFAFLQGKKNLLFAIGLMLFLCCDLCTGLMIAMGTYIPISESSFIYKILHSNFNFIWFFYLPSQALISTFCAIKNQK